MQPNLKHTTMAQIKAYHSLSPEDTAKLEATGLKEGQLIAEREVMDVVGKIYRETILNIMIQHHGTENTTVWVDRGNFRQK